MGLLDNFYSIIGCPGSAVKPVGGAAATPPGTVTDEKERFPHID